MEIILWVTDDCNLNCTYCYEKKQKGIYYMNQNTALSIIENIIKEIKENNYKSLSISFMGGEPLLNFPIINFIVNYFNRALICFNNVYTKNIFSNNNFNRFIYGN